MSEKVPRCSLSYERVGEAGVHREGAGCLHTHLGGWAGRPMWTDAYPSGWRAKAQYEAPHSPSNKFIQC